jgi:hypothetical protein
MQRGAEDGSFKIAENDPVALAAAVLAAWALVHGLTLLYIDGLATLETSLSIEQLAPSGRASTRARCLTIGVLAGGTVVARRNVVYYRGAPLPRGPFKSQVRVSAFAAD